MNNIYVAMGDEYGHKPGLGWTNDADNSKENRPHFEALKGSTSCDQVAGRGIWCSLEKG